MIGVNIMRLFERSYIFLQILICFVIILNQANAIETVQPETSSIRESFVEPSRTRLETHWPILMPIDGTIDHIDLEPGDVVSEGETLVPFDLEPLRLEVEEAHAAVNELESRIKVNEYDKLEKTALQETRKAVEAAKEALKAADAQVDAQKVRTDRAERELERHQELARADTISQSELEDYILAAETAVIELRKEQFTRAALNAIVEAYDLLPQLVLEYMAKKDLERVVLVEQLAQAKARLAKAEHRLELASIASPINGVVLERYLRGGGPVAAGTELMLLGDLDEMEVISEVLTEDALRIGIGSKVEFKSPAWKESLTGAVKKIQPAGFTKLSSLGVEQQRVNVISSLPESPVGLGTGYRLMARFITGSKENALVIPRFSVLQEPDGTYYVFKVVNGKLKKQEIEIGLRSDLELEVTQGLSKKDSIVKIPDTTMKEGREVK